MHGLAVSKGLLLLLLALCVLRLPCERCVLCCPPPTHTRPTDTSRGGPCKPGCAVLAADRPAAHTTPHLFVCEFAHRLPLAGVAEVACLHNLRVFLQWWPRKPHQQCVSGAAVCSARVCVRVSLLCAAHSTSLPTPLGDASCWLHTTCPPRSGASRNTLKTSSHHTHYLAVTPCTPLRCVCASPPAQEAPDLASLLRPGLQNHPCHLHGRLLCHQSRPLCLHP